MHDSSLKFRSQKGGSKDKDMVEKEDEVSRDDMDLEGEGGSMMKRKESGSGLRSSTETKKKKREEEDDDEEEEEVVVVTEVRRSSSGQSQVKGGRGVGAEVDPMELEGAPFEPYQTLSRPHRDPAPLKTGSTSSPKVCPYFPLLLPLVFILTPLSPPRWTVLPPYPTWPGEVLPHKPQVRWND